MILALGESIVAIAAGLGGAHLTWRIALGAALSILIAVGMYAAYFARLPGRLEEALERAQGRPAPSSRRMSSPTSTSRSSPASSSRPWASRRRWSTSAATSLGPTGGWALGGGVALFLAGAVAAQVRARGTWPSPRAAAIVVLIGVSPLLAAVPALAAVAIVAAAALALAVIDSAAGPPAARAPGGPARDAAPTGRQ